MHKLVKNLLKCRQNVILNNSGLNLSFSTSNSFKQLSKPVLRRPQSSKLKQIDAFGWCLLVIPVASFSLGVWQVQRKKWKEALIAEMREKTTSDPVKLPKNPEDIQALEYRPVHVRGTFLHDREILVGPRTLLKDGDASTQSSLMTGASTNQGYCVVTPFKLEDRDEIILVNRGWVPSKKRDQRTRSKGQVDGVVDVIGIVRLHEPRPTFSMKNQEGSNIFFYRDLNAMCKMTGASPIFIDATDELNADGGPIGGQTRVTLRNEHMSYILTWFSLCGATSWMWYKKFLVR